MPPAAPAPWLMFVIMFVLVGLAIGLIVLLGGTSRVLRGESFWPRDERAARPATRAARSATFRGQFKRANRGQPGSARANAENGDRSAVQPVAERSIVQPTSMLPATTDELQRLAHTIALYAKRPNKELAILEAWGATKGEGDRYQRANALFEAAMSDTARQAAKAKPPQQITETA